MNKKTIALFLLLSFINLPLATFGKDILVRNSTRIPITFEEVYTSKNVEEGQKLEGIIAEDVKIDNVIIFKTGNKATLNVSEVKKAGFIGNAGELYLINGEVYDTKGVSHAIEFNRKYTGEEKTYPKVCLACGLLIILAPLALLAFVKGGQAKVKIGEVINVSLRNDFVY